MNEPKATLPKTIQVPGSGGCFAIFAAIVLLPVGIGAYRYATMEAGVAAEVAGGCVAAISAALVLAIYGFFNDETVFEIDALGMTVTRRSRLGPFSGRGVVDVDLRWARLGSLRDVTERRLTKNGSMQTSYRLALGDKTIRSSELGTMERDGKYLELLDAIRAAVGDRLVADEDLGDLEGPLKRLVDERIAKSGSGEDGTR